MEAGMVKEGILLDKKMLVAGAGGFIGWHMTRFLKKRGFWVRGVDIKRPEFAPSDADEFLLLDLRRLEDCRKAVKDIEYVFQFAANMGGIGYITKIGADIIRDNVLINTHMLEASLNEGIERFFFASSACIYPNYKQTSEFVLGLKEEDALPADPNEYYGWEKLFTEMMCRAYREDYGLHTVVARLHNIFGPYGTYEGGREKAPAALCRKVAMAKDGDSIEIWGDGKQTRSFLYVDDCVRGIWMLVEKDYPEPLNIGSDRRVTIDELVDMIIKISGKKLKKVYDLTKPQGVRGRNSDNTKVIKVLNWKPEVPLEKGLEITYRWIEEQIKKRESKSI
jgi:nucleoside-diphosphate-sugar epimerase